MYALINDFRPASFKNNSSSKLDLISFFGLYLVGESIGI
jgi:hypothetical protein